MRAETVLPSEAKTRKVLIDDQLAHAGWSLEKGNLVEEFHLKTPLKRLHKNNTSYQDNEERVDYALLRRDGKPIAIVEAKRSSRDPLSGERQASDYADYIRNEYGIEPFIFLSNGTSTWFWDREQYPLRQVNGFFTLDDLERLAFQRQHKHQYLSQLGPQYLIVNRPYQVEAIKRVTEALEKKQRKFLLVMATGTGKTRTTIALIDLLMRANWVQKVLFLADRRELVRQALGEFKEYLPDETRARIENGNVDNGARIHVSTYQSMMQIYQQLSPAYYDLIIADESHRSIYNHYKLIFDYFDAMQLGLTATPTDHIDHNTFAIFQCPDGLPTFYYSYEAAIREGYLVNYRVLEAQTRFQLQGIKAGQLPSEFQRQLEEHGIDPSEIDFEGSDLERRVTNTGTNDALVQEFMEKCRKDATGTYPAKSIIFTISHRHAVELFESFNRFYPDLQRLGIARIIDSHMERADKTLDDFKRKDMPRIAISVDMLDTGIDVPAIQNLVFAKPIFSQVKFWQMIGRGTRQWSDPQTAQKKVDFLIIDHWNSFSYFNMNPDGEIAHPTEPLPVRLFRLRLEKLIILLSLGETEAINIAINQLQEMLAQVPKDNVNVLPHLANLADLTKVKTWEKLSTDGISYLGTNVAPLLRFMPNVHLFIMGFELFTEQLAIAWLTGQKEDIEKLRPRIVQSLKSLPISLRDVQVQADKLTWMISLNYWENLNYGRVMDLQTTFAPLMRYHQNQRSDIIKLDLPDEIISRRWIIYGPSGEGTFADSYRRQAEVYIKDLSEELPALLQLKQGKSLSESDLQTIIDSLNKPDLFITENVLRQAYGRSDADLISFLKHILNLSYLPSKEEKIVAEFDEFIRSHSHFTARQINFVRTVRSAVLRQAILTSKDFERPPFNRIGSAEHMFKEGELMEILDFANRLVG